MEMTNVSEVSTVRCMIIGDQNCGIEMMLRKYATYSGALYDSENGHVITAFNDKKCVFTNYLSNNYVDNIHVFLLCVSIAYEDIVEETVRMVLSTITDQIRTVPFVLVGTHIEKRLVQTIDLNADWQSTSRAYRTMPLHRAESFAQRIGAVKYLECSEITGEGVEEVFEDSFEVGYQYAIEQQRNLLCRKQSRKSFSKRLFSCIMQ
ncbi:Ras family protein [Dictyocaulus viviparus]|uniref:Ras family protein n=1 Tax=Dictyocaulus viviparus TaxID=29172 RepID=A0A0D8Y113_DICVI|nr:Ras family protein [Dictyocaulus viviparus]